MDWVLRRSHGVCRFVGNFRVMSFSLLAAERSPNVRYWGKRTSERQGYIDVNDVVDGARSPGSELR
jgi:hypothetical protein